MDASWSLYRCVISWFLSLHLLVGQKTSNSKWKRFSGFIVFLAIIWVLQELTTVKILRYVILFIGKLSIKVPSFSFIFKLKTGFTLQVWWTAYSQFTVCVTFSLILWTSIKKFLFSFGCNGKLDIYDDLISRRVHSSDAEKFAEICPCCTGCGWGVIWLDFFSPNSLHNSETERRLLFWPFGFWYSGEWYHLCFFARRCISGLWSYHRERCSFGLAFLFLLWTLNSYPFGFWILIILLWTSWCLFRFRFFVVKCRDSFLSSVRS